MLARSEPIAHGGLPTGRPCRSAAPRRRRDRIPAGRDPPGGCGRARVRRRARRGRRLVHATGASGRGARAVARSGAGGGAPSGSPAPGRARGRPPRGAAWSATARCGRAQRREVGEPTEGEDEAEHAEPGGRRDGDDAEQRAEHPGRLEARLEAGDARPRTASGPSRCSRLSKPIFPAAAPRPTARNDSGIPNVARRTTPNSVVAAQTSSEPARIISSRRWVRRRGAMRFPPKSPMPAAVATVPSANRSFLNVNAAKNWRKPIAPRRIAMADPASRIEGWCSSVRSSSGSTGAWVRRIRGIRPRTRRR